MPLLFCSVLGCNFVFSSSEDPLELLLLLLLLFDDEDEEEDDDDDDEEDRGDREIGFVIKWLDLDVWAFED